MYAYSGIFVCHLPDSNQGVKWIMKLWCLRALSWAIVTVFDARMRSIYSRLLFTFCSEGYLQTKDVSHSEDHFTNMAYKKVLPVHALAIQLYLCNSYSVIEASDSKKL